MTTEQDLRAVLELRAKLLAADAFDTDGEYEYAEVAYSSAANSLLDTHGPALLRAVEDARRWQVARQGREFSVFRHDSAEHMTELHDDAADAAIDAAIAEGEG